MNHGIWFHDLSPQAQANLLAFLGVSHPSQVGYDREPIVYVEHPSNQPVHNVVEETVIINQEPDRVIIVDDDDDFYNRHGHYRRHRYYDD